MLSLFRAESLMRVGGDQKAQEERGECKLSPMVCNKRQDGVCPGT